MTATGYFGIACGKAPLLASERLSTPKTMSTHSNSNYPKLHNAMWPGLVGKSSPGAEPCLELDTMLNLTAQAEVDGIRFDGINLFLYDPHTSIETDDNGIKQLTDKI